MPLRITSVSFDDFRNYRRFQLDDIGDITLLVGPNAVGKTNIVEGIQLLTAMASFRHPKISHLIRDGGTFARAQMHVSGNKRELDVEMTLAEGKRRYLLNGKVRKTPDLKGLMPSVTFTPDDLSIAKGSNSKRRDMLDAIASQLSANHAQIKRDYDEVLRSKNRMLKDEADPLLVDSVNEIMIRVGAQLTCYRAALFARLMPYLEAHYSSMAGGRDRVTGRYVPSWVSEQELLTSKENACPLSREDARDRFAQALSLRKSEERARHRAVLGPHADRIDFFVDGRDASEFASQGQQRSLVLAEKLAEVSLIEEVLEARPVLLLDDVMSELDASRREALIGLIDRGLQTFVTTTNLSYFDEDIASRARVVMLPMDEKGSYS